MDHAEARARLEERYVEPVTAGRLDAELEAHLAECSGCAAEDAALRATAAAVQLAIGPPPGLRRRVLDNVAELGLQRGPVTVGDYNGRRTALAPRLLAAAAVLAVLAFVAGALSAALLAPPADDRLARAAAMMAELARDPAAETFTLRLPSGAPGGTAMFDAASGRLVVFSAALPAGDLDYDCFLERDNQRTWLGPMFYESRTHFWAGPVDEAPDLGRPGDRLIVLVDADDAAPALAAEF